MLPLAPSLPGTPFGALWPLLQDSSLLGLKISPQLTQNSPCFGGGPWGFAPTTIYRCFLPGQVCQPQGPEEQALPSPALLPYLSETKTSRGQPWWRLHTGPMLTDQGFSSPTVGHSGCLPRTIQTVGGHAWHSEAWPI